MTSHGPGVWASFISLGTAPSNSPPGDLTALTPHKTADSNSKRG